MSSPSGGFSTKVGIKGAMNFKRMNELAQTRELRCQSRRAPPPEPVRLNDRSDFSQQQLVPAFGTTGGIE
jgi:hypothetical protein